MRILALTFAIAVAVGAAAPGTVSAATRTWSGGGGAANTNWSNPANWVGNSKPNPGDTLVFPAGVAQLATNNNFADDVEFVGMSFADNYTVTGNRILVGATIDLSTASSVTISANLTIKGATGSNFITVTAAANGTITLAGIINDQGAPAQFRKAGAGRVELSGVNTFTGATSVDAGILRVSNAAGLGASSAGATINTGASLELALAGGMMAEPMTLVGTGTGDVAAGTLTAVSNGTLTGLITIAAPSIFVSPGVTLTMTGQVTGATGFSKDGAGTLRFEGSTPNGFSGKAVINAGTLLLARTIFSIPNGVIIGDGAGSDIVRLETPNQINGDVIIEPSGWLDLPGVSDDITELSMTGGRVSTTGAGTLGLNGNVTVDLAPGAGTALIEGRLDLGVQPRDFFVKGNASPALNVTAIISGGGPGVGITKVGPSPLRLAGANTYGGVTQLKDGLIIAANPQAFGTASGYTNLSFSGLFISLEGDVTGETLSAVPNAPTDKSLVCPSGGGPAVCTWGGPIHLSSGTVGFAADPGKTLRLAGPIDGNLGVLRAHGGGTIELGGNDVYNGGTEIAGNTTLRILAANRIPDTGVVTLKSGGTLDVAGLGETIGGLASADATSKVLLGSATLTVAQTQTATFSGVISGSGGLIKQGNGRLELANINTYTGQTTVLTGTLRIGAGGEIGDVTVNSNSAWLDGTGKVGAVTVTSGGLIAGSPTGTLTTGSLTMTSASTLEASIYSLAANGHGMLDVKGTVTLGGATFNPYVKSDLPLAESSEFIIIKNDGSDPVVGTFDGLPEGAEIDVSEGRKVRITYKGGDGNDVALSAGSREYFLAEGATGEFFDLDILIANPNATEAPVTLTFLLPGGGTIVQKRTVPAMSRITVRVDDIEGLQATAVSTVVTSDTPAALIVERTMRWDKSGYGAHTEKASAGPAHEWFFAEGAQGFFRTYLLLANPQDKQNAATVTFLRENAAPIVRTYTIPPFSRFTVDAGDEAELATYSFGMKVAFDQPGVAERAMYFGMNPLWIGGHESAGATGTSKDWYLAEGATGSFFETFILLSNPYDDQTIAELTFLPSTGVPVKKTKTIPANGRVTVNIESEDPSLDNAAVATVVHADGAILVERSQYWPDPSWYEAHNSFGVTSAGQKWGLAEGRTGGPEKYQTFVLIANPGEMEAQVTVTFLRENGAPFEKTFTVKPTSRFNVDVGPGTLVPELHDESFGALIVSSAPVVVERAMYANANGQLWSAGTNATGTALP